MPPIDEDFFLWIVAPALVSLAVVLIGLRVRPRAARTTLLVIGIAALALTALWFLLVLRVEAIEYRSIRGPGTPPVRG
jgi:hypothetical protein